ncbi:RNA polymerase sigma factor [Nonomuraea sp. B12E4]|uniref:RNA polymerase sigma factor n=1 Tax=Nonomuraea sp. B12E4 TaxID=3153564 RepID=UPI00325E080C
MAGEESAAVTCEIAQSHHGALTIEESDAGFRPFYGRRYVRTDGGQASGRVAGTFVPARGFMKDQRALIELINQCAQEETDPERHLTAWEAPELWVSSSESNGPDHLPRSPGPTPFQFTFLTAFRRRGRYDLARRSALPWLYGIATNLIGRHKRTEARQLNLLARTGVDPITEPFTPRSDERLSAQAAQQHLAAALAALPAGHRDVLLLVTCGGLGYTEAAEALGIRVGGVESGRRAARGVLSARRAAGRALPRGGHDSRGGDGEGGAGRRGAHGHRGGDGLAPRGQGRVHLRPKDLRLSRPLGD